MTALRFAIYEWPEYAAGGALMGYGPSQALISRLVAELIDRVLGVVVLQHTMP